MSRRTLVLILGLALTACAQSFDSTTLGVPVTMAAGPEEAVQGAAFTTSVHSVHAFFGLLTLSQANLQKALARQLVGGQQVAQLKIKVRSRWSDVLITLLTGGLMVPRTVTFQGVIVGREP